jgi:hypothetical protein
MNNYAQLAEEHRHRNRKIVTPVDMPTSLDLFDEDVHKAMDEHGHIVRKDMFKGNAVRHISNMRYLILLL